MFTDCANATKTGCKINMSTLETLLEDRLRSELVLQQQLKTLTEALRKQLQEAQRKQTQELERRIYQNALLSKDVVEAGDNREMNHHTNNDGLRKSTLQHQKTVHHPKQSERLNSSSPALVSSKNWKNDSIRTSTPTPTWLRKEREAEAESQKKFCAHPVPSNVTQSLYQEMMKLKEKERKQGHEERRNFLLSIQKPFSFQEREKEKREKLIVMLSQVSQDQKKKWATVRKPPNKEAKNLLDSELKDQDLSTQITTQTTVTQKSLAVSGSPKLRTANRTRKEKLGFLDEKPSFHPKIKHQVPDFSRLHRALQTEGLRRTQSKDGIKCQPFFLRTSALPARQSRMSPEIAQIPRSSNLNRSKSVGALTSLSTDTLPTYITDAARKRCAAIRKSVEMREKKNQESVDWLKKYQTKSQAMKTAVTLHAKLLDPHSSLKDVCDEKLHQHWLADQQRMREYTRELRDMKARVRERPYLFEQVTQKSAKAHAEQTYRDKLERAGLKEQFVQEKGETTSRSETEETDDIQSRDENVDDGEKIEDVDEKSVKSKEEMP